MEEKTKTSSRLVFSIILIATVFVIAFFSTIILLRWNSNEVVGLVSNIENGSLTIAVPHGEPHTLLLTQDTEVYRGKEKGVDISVGDMVLVVYTVNDTGEETANVVRIVNPPKQVPPRPSSENELN